MGSDDRAAPGHGRVRRATLLVMTLAAAVIAACGPSNEDTTPSTGGDADAPEIRPAEDVIDGDIQVETDASGTSATVLVTTSVDLACAVVFGTDGAFGGIATDQDMGGGAHSDHQAVLSGLEPGTGYVYRLQGSDADGTVYVSDVYSFTTPEGGDDDLPGQDVTAEATVADVSSEFSEDFAAELALDGNLGTAWSSDGDGDDAWIELDLGRETELAAVGLRSRSMSDGTSIIETFTVQVDDGEVFGPFDASTSSTEVAELTATGRHVRIEAEETTGGNTGAAEIVLRAAD